MSSDPSGRMIGRIGPNAILQLAAVLSDRLGQARAAAIIAQAALHAWPDGSTLIDETDAARLHCAVRQGEPMRASELLREAGERTAAYILAHRIPPLAKWVLKHLPAALAAPLLARAIAQHAWTFAGSGTFRVITAWHFVLENNPLIAKERADPALHVWHEAVFETLYRALVTPDAHCRAAADYAKQGTIICHFRLEPERIAQRHEATLNARNRDAIASKRKLLAFDRESR